MNRQTKKQAMALFVVVIFFGSVVAFAVMQALGGAPAQTPEQPPPKTIPDQRIFTEYEPLTENLFIERGYTIAVLDYDGTCCQDTIDYIEAMSSDTSGQIAVFKLADETVNQTALKIKSLIGTSRLKGENVTADNIFDSLCTIMMDIPLECGLRFIDNEVNESA
ncbi:hypothetical protein CL614_06505 [archaeon]|nr:hypothetical protein [archaeon]|tara:strand:+ start:1416 stop:1907 length:492 start_codon:yes stop_codon:yes gene_type:complete